MVKRTKSGGKTPKKLRKAHVPNLNLVEDIKHAITALIERRIINNKELDYALVTTTEINTETIVDINDEFSRELLFSHQAKMAATVVLPKLEKLGIPTQLPETFKGEFLKDDKQMAKVNDTLRAKKETIERSEKVRKLRELKKMGKKIQQEVLKKRQKDKREFLEKVKKKPVAELFED